MDATTPPRPNLPLFAQLPLVRYNKLVCASLKLSVPGAILRERSANLTYFPTEEPDNLTYGFQVLERRRRTLYGFLLLTAGGMLLIYLQLLVLDYVTDEPVTDFGRVQIAAVVTLAGAAICYVIARRGAVTAPGYIILGMALLIQSKAPSARAAASS